MPTLEHNGLIELFRDNPRLAPHLLELLFHLKLPSYASVEVAEAALDQLIPVEFRADLVLELRDAAGTVVLAVVLEIQRDEDPRKKFSWPVYLTAVRARKSCPTVVLVVTPDEGVASWAAKPIDLGLGFCTFRALVLGPKIVPEVTDPTNATQETELSVLSAVAHGNGPNGVAIVEAAMQALANLDEEHAEAYFQIIYGALREPMRRALEARNMERMDGPATPFLNRLRAQGRAEGMRDHARRVLLRLLTRAGIQLTDAERARIEACDDEATLDRWAENVLGAKTASDVLS